jgi:hypothetical protein
MAPGARTVTAVFTPSSSCFVTPNATAPLTITTEDAVASIDDGFYSLCATCSSTTVTLVALVKDITAVGGDADAGDIRDASVTFVNPASGTPYCTAPVGLISAADPKSGLASCTFAANLGNADSTSYDVGVKVDGYYARAAAYDAVVTVSRSYETGFITGGGYLLLSGSSGLLAGDRGTRNNFGFDVKYNKSKTNLQGHINTILRRLESDGVLHVYQVKGNAMLSLSVDTSQNATHPSPTAVFTGQASIQDVTNPLAPVAVDGGATFKVTMTDKGEPGTGDLIGLSVFASANKGGGLWYSSSWSGTATLEQALAGGNLIVH